MIHLNRERALNRLDAFRASAAAWSGGDEKQNWVDEQIKLAGGG